MFENVRIKERLTKAFVMVAAITAIGAVVGLAAMLVMSNRYSSALVNYGFSQGDIGKAMITFANTRSATRGIIGFDEQGLLDDAMTEHDEQKAKFENYFATVGDVVTTSEEKALYQQISDKLQQYWAAEEPDHRAGCNHRCYTVHSGTAADEGKSGSDLRRYLCRYDRTDEYESDGGRPLVLHSDGSQRDSCDCDCGSVSSGNGYGQQAWQSGGKGNLRTA